MITAAGVRSLGSVKLRDQPGSLLISYGRTLTHFVPRSTARRFWLHLPRRLWEDALGIGFVDYTNLKVTDDHINEFSAAIVAFWENVPDNFYDDPVGDLPKWFEKAWLRDLENYGRSAK